MITETKLTELETKVLEAIKKNAQDVSGGSFAMSDEIHAYLPDIQRLSIIAGVVSSLVKKGIVKVDRVESNGIKRLSQITVIEAPKPVDPVKPSVPGTDSYGFINTLEGCRFVSGLHMKNLTIEPPTGCRIGSDYIKKFQAVDSLVAALKVVRTDSAIWSKIDPMAQRQIEEALRQASNF